MELLLTELGKTVGRAGWVGKDQEFVYQLSGYIEYTVVYISWEFKRGNLGVSNI